MVMQKIFFAVLLCFFYFHDAVSQNGNPIRKYLDQNLKFTRPAFATYTADIVKENDHWLLTAYYPGEKQPIVKASFKDRDCTIKDGNFTVFNENGTKSVEGNFLENRQHGKWQTWYANGKPKVSWQAKYHYLAGTWQTWYEDGKVATIVNYPHPDSIILSNNLQLPPIQQKQGSLLDQPQMVEFKVGPYLTYWPNGNLKDSGAYLANVQDGEWTIRYESGLTESTGRFDKGNRTGSWRFYYENGQLATLEKYVNNKVAELICYDEKGNISGNACNIQKPPVPLGKFDDFEVYMVKNIFWPKKLPDWAEGDVKVTFTITKAGKLVNFKAVHSPHQALTDEVQRFFNTVEWSPAISHNRPIDANVEYVVPFYR